MILRGRVVYDAITKKHRIKNMIDSRGNLLLDDFLVVDYVTSENIPTTMLGDKKVAVRPDVFFHRYQYIAEVNINSTLGARGMSQDLLQAYDKEKIFPHEFSVHFFNTFLVVEIIPVSERSEFLVLAPQKPKKGDVENMAGLMASMTVTGIFSSISSNPELQVTLGMKIDKLLAFLRSGVGKKKILGIFDIFN